MSAPLTLLPPPIGPYLARYVRLRRRHALMRATGLAVAFFFAWGLGCCMIDRVAPLLAVTRLALLLIGTAAVVAIVMRPLARWLSGTVDWRAAAADVERRDVRLSQRLQTVTAELLGPSRHAGSREIVDTLAREVGEVLVGSRPQALLRWRPTLAPWLGVVALVAAAAGMSRVPEIGMGRLAERFVVPLRAVPPVTTTRLTLQPLAASVVEGAGLRVGVSAERLEGGGVTLYYGMPGLTSWTSVAMTRGGAGAAFEAVIPAATHDLRYFARGGDARSATGTLRVLRKPALKEVRVRYTYPPHTGRAPLTVANADGLIEAPVGTQAAVTFVASELLASATVQIAGQAIETTPGDTPRERRATLAVTKDAPYSLAMVSIDRVAGGGPSSMMIRAVPDRPPLVRVLQPPGELRLSPRDILSLPFQALDDYGVTSLTSNVQITPSGVDASGEPINLAQGKPATQPTTWGGATADRAVDGKTDGAFPSGSVTHTDTGPHAWWQVDLGNVAPVSVIEIWNRTDAVPQRLSDFFVFVSDAPFLSDDPAAITAQAGVATYRIPTQCGAPTRVDVFRTARFVRVQLSKPDYLSLAEVRVLQAKPAAAGEGSSRSFDTNLAVSGDPRQQEGEAVLDLARIKVGVGDVVTISVTATDTGKQAGVGGPIRVVVSPRSVDQRTYDRINELKRAGQLSAALVAQLEAASRAFEPASARGVGHVDAYVAALASATRELSGVSDTAAALQSALLRCIIRSDGPQLSTALAAMVDEAQQLSAASGALGAKFAFDASPSEADRAALASTLAAARRVTGHVEAILRGEQAGAVLADLDNLRASELGTPSGKEAADRARERARRVREDVEAAAKELGLAAGGADVEQRLKAMTAARAEAIKAYAVPDYAPAAQSYAAAMASRAALPGLVPRLSAAAQAEAVRPDGNLVRARDLQLAASAALRVRDAAAATRNEFITNFALAVAALQREHAAAAAPAPPTSAPATTTAATAPTTAPTTTTVATTTKVATTVSATSASDATRAAAADARRKLSLWARGENQQSATEAEALARAQELAMQANADLAQRQYESAEQADERIARELRLAERTFPRAAQRFEEARQEIRRSTETARRIDRLAADQQQLTGGGGQGADAARAAQAAQERLSAELAKTANSDDADGMHLAPEEGAGAGAGDSRLAAVTAIRGAQERLAAMPQQLRDVESAMAERAAASTRLRQLRQQSMPPDGEAAAARAIREAESQLSEAEQRLTERMAPLADGVPLELARSLSAFAPETSDATRGLLDRLRPAMSRLGRAADAGAGDAGSAVAELRGAIDGLQTQLKDAQAALLERDPLTAARAYAQASASSLASDPAGAASQQRNTTAALARAWDAAVHEAAAARLAGLPTMRPLFTPPPGVGESTQPPQGAAAGVAARLPMFFDWGRLPWRPAQEASASARPSHPSGYEDALQAYFEALGVTQPRPPTTQQVKP